jgi:hypothetical protein
LEDTAAIFWRGFHTSPVLIPLLSRNHHTAQLGLLALLLIASYGLGLQVMRLRARPAVTVTSTAVIGAAFVTLHLITRGARADVPCWGGWPALVVYPVEAFLFGMLSSLVRARRSKPRESLSEWVAASQAKGQD